MVSSITLLTNNTLLTGRCRILLAPSDRASSQDSSTRITGFTGSVPRSAVSSPPPSTSCSKLSSTSSSSVRHTLSTNIEVAEVSRRFPANQDADRPSGSEPNYGRFFGVARPTGALLETHGTPTTGTPGSPTTTHSADLEKGSEGTRMEYSHYPALPLHSHPASTSDR